MPAKTQYVFIDTSIFVALKYDFHSPNLMRIVQLIDDGVLKLISTSVTIGEMENDLPERADQANKAIREIVHRDKVAGRRIPRNALTAMKKLKVEDILTELKDEFKRFLTLTDTEVLAVNKVSTDKVFELYFKNSPPFGKGNKKREFPDAFAGLAIDNWLSGKPKKKVYVVSGDGDWKRFCECNDSLIHIGMLSELFEQFADEELVVKIKSGIRFRSEILTKKLQATIESGSIYFYADDTLTDGEIEDTVFNSADISHISILEIGDGEATAQIDMDTKLVFSVTAGDSNTFYVDHETDTGHYVFRLSGEVERNESITLTVKVRFDKASPDNVAIRKVEYPEEGIAVSIDEDELSRDDEDEAEEWASRLDLD